MTYKGYVAYITYDEDSKTFCGEVIGLKDFIIFEGCSVKELEQAFKDAVNDYLAWCKELGEKPQKSYSGNLRLRMDATLHANLAKEAAIKGMSLNELILNKLSPKIS